MRRVLALALPDLAVDLARRRRRRAERPAPGSAAPLDVGPPVPRRGRRGAKGRGETTPDRGVAGGAIPEPANTPRPEAPGGPRRGASGPLRRGASGPPRGQTPSLAASRAPRSARRAEWPHPGSPILLTETVAGRVLVVRRCPSAAARGVRIGLTVDEARALLAPAQPWIEEHRPDRDARALAALGQWALRFSPTVALDGDDGLVLDVAGLERLAGDEGRLARRVHEAVARLGFRARAAVADTVGAAAGLARYASRPLTIVPSGEEERALAPLPLEALRVSAQVVDGLRELSVVSVGDLVRLDRARIAARFGADVLLRLDQALGRAFEPITPLRPEEPPEVERIFEGPVQRLEGVLLCIEELVHELCAALGSAGLGVTELVLELAASDRAPGTPPERLAVALGRASANGRHVWNVVRPRAERMQLGYGVERVRLVARHTARLPLEQVTAFGRVEERTPGASRALDRALGELVDVLVARFGTEAVRVARAVETHVPERAFRVRPLLRDEGRAAEAWATAAARPSLVLARPEPAVITPASQSSGPLPAVGACLAWRGLVLVLEEVLGPERIARPWWEARDDAADEVHRDYYRTRTQCGRRLWLFERDGGTFVHGEWA